MKFTNEIKSKVLKTAWKDYKIQTYNKPFSKVLKETWDWYKTNYKKKKIWIKYKTWTGLPAGYSIDEYGKVSIKLFTKVPKKWYYECFNEAGLYFDEVISLTLKNNF